METEQTISLEDRKAQSKPLVLVVDDDFTHQRLLQLLADRLGITTYTASSCDQAIEALQTFPFDVILMDYRMPEVDGCKCTQRIRAMRELRGDIPIIAVTAHVTGDSRERCLKSGMDDFLGKPFTFEELHEKLCFWLDKRQSERATPAKLNS